MILIQIFGGIFCFYVLFKCITSFKKNEFSLGDMLVWLILSMSLLFLTLFPQYFWWLSPYLGVHSLVNIIFSIIVGFLLLIVFYLYVQNNKLRLNFEQSIRTQAQEHVKKGKK